MAIGDNLLRCTNNSLLIDAKAIMEDIVKADTDYDRNLHALAQSWLARLDWWLRNEENGL